MLRERANEILKSGYGYDCPFNDTMTALLEIRGKNPFLPEYDVYGNPVELAEWVFVDMSCKIDSEEYGEIIYIYEGSHA